MTLSKNVFELQATTMLVPCGNLDVHIVWQHLFPVLFLAESGPVS
jgi:hypothetical protein